MSAGSRGAEGRGSRRGTAVVDGQRLIVGLGIGVSFVHQLYGRTQRLGQLAAFMTGAEVRFDRSIIGRAAGERTTSQPVKHIIAIEEEFHRGSPTSLFSKSVASGASSSPSHLASCNS